MIDKRRPPIPQDIIESSSQIPNDNLQQDNIKQISMKNFMHLNFLNYYKVKKNQQPPLILNNIIDSNNNNIFIIPQTFSQKNTMPNKLVGNYRHNEQTPFNCMKWFHGGRLLLAGLATGDLVIVNGFSFKKDNSNAFLQTKDQYKLGEKKSGIRSFSFFNKHRLILVGDKTGQIYIMDFNLKVTQQIGKQTVRPKQGPPSLMDTNLIKEFSISPSNEKFVCCSSQELLIWDTSQGELERRLQGHSGYEINTCDWHPEQALLLSGSKNNDVKIWCARSGQELSVIKSHKNNVNKVRWHKDGNCFLSCSKDSLIKIYDIRQQKKELMNFKNACEVHSVQWHPLIPSLFASSDSDSKISFWDASSQYQSQLSRPIGQIVKKFADQNIQNKAVFDIAWSPLGHTISSLANDKRIEFWANDYSECDNGMRIKPEQMRPEQIQYAYGNYNQN